MSAPRPESLRPPPGRTAGVAIALFAVLATWPAGCRSADDPERDVFRTSGDPAADQRAAQRVNEAEAAREDADEASEDPAITSLHVRLGGDAGVRAIVSDFVQRVLADPRVNWERRGVESSGVLGLGGQSMSWDPTRENVRRLERHLVQFIAVAAGGPTRYDGRPLGDVHAGMRITNSQFDASIGALKATLDRLAVAAPEQKELLALFESARPQIVEER